MTTSHRDLALVDPWQRSLERSLHRRAIAPQVRRSVARRRRASVALSTLMVAGPTGSLLAAAGFGLGRGAEIAQASPANRAIGNSGTPATMAFELGSRGDAVEEIQRQLGVSADGIFGPVTQVAVQRFQAVEGLDVDGVVGPATWTALFGLEQAASAAGARDGSVAVILRERDESGSSSGAPGADPAGGGSSGADTDHTEDTLAVGGDIPASAPPTSTRPAKNAPATKPVSAPAPSNGACGPLRLSAPVKGTVTSGFGPRWGRNHDGLDIAAPSGTPIRAAECGIVSFAGVQSGYGNMVCVKHSSRFETCYAHMTKYAVAQGQRVDQGQVIGYVGCTGNCTGPHLHFETRVDGAARDPRPYLGGGSVPGAPTVKAAAAPKLTASIRKDVARARVTAKATIGVQPRATTAAPPVATTGAPAPTTVSPTPATSAPPTTTAPAPTTPQTTYAAPAPVAAPTPTPEPTTPAPSPVAAAPTPAVPPTTTTPAPPTTAPAPVTDTPAPVEPQPGPVETPSAPIDPVPTPESAPSTAGNEGLAPPPAEAPPAASVPPAAEALAP